MEGYEFWSVNRVDLIDPPRHVDFIEVGRNNNVISIERFTGNGIIKIK